MDQVITIFGTVLASVVSTGLALKIFEWLAKRSDVKIDETKEARKDLKARVENLEVRNEELRVEITKYQLLYYEEKAKVMKLEVQVEYLMRELGRLQERESKAT